MACNGKNCPSKSYKDVDQTQWYHNAVDYVLGNDLMKGTGQDDVLPGCHSDARHGRHGPRPRRPV